MGLNPLLTLDIRKVILYRPILDNHEVTIVEAQYPNTVLYFSDADAICSYGVLLPSVALFCNSTEYT